MSYLSGRTQVVEIQNITLGLKNTYQSNPQPVTCGVPQESVLGPAIFVLFVNDFPAYIQDHNTNCVMYADDTTLLIRDDTAEGVHATACNSLCKALTYCRKNDLAVNPSKTIQINFSLHSKNT
uniref:Reverse transcriptase domain-containing protein n=1 Tax=Homalodisca liturata TaxID=320908 RepID=A0A1B6JIC3_9HEMI